MIFSFVLPHLRRLVSFFVLFFLFDRSETPSTPAIAAAMASKIPFGTLRGCGRIWDLGRVRDGKGCLGKENGLPKWVSFFVRDGLYFVSSFSVGT